MKRFLDKNKKSGLIDYIEVPLCVGRAHGEFIGYDLKRNYFFIIFFDNKYREDKLRPENCLQRLNQQLAEYKENVDDIGIYNTIDKYNETKKQIDFIEKYLKHPTYITELERRAQVENE
jgi:hypothetical protein